MKAVLTYASVPGIHSFSEAVLGYASVLLSTHLVKCRQHPPIGPCSEQELCIVLQAGIVHTLPAPVLGRLITLPSLSISTLSVRGTSN